MEASDSNPSSYAWKSILKGRYVYKQEARWRVGNGESTSIWGNFWLPLKHHPRVLSPVVDDLFADRVSSLINHQTRS